MPRQTSMPRLVESTPRGLRGEVAGVVVACGIRQRLAPPQARHAAPGERGEARRPVVVVDPVVADLRPRLGPGPVEQGQQAVVEDVHEALEGRVVDVALAFPGVFRGAFDVRAKDINDEMKVAAAYAIANIITDEERNAEYIIPNPFDKRVAKAVAEAVAKAARDTGVARI